MSLGNIVINISYMNSHQGGLKVYYRGPRMDDAMAEVERIRGTEDYGLGDTLHGSIYDRDLGTSTTFLYEHGKEVF